jgi:hydrogenase 3 maturation protease
LLSIPLEENPVEDKPISRSVPFSQDPAGHLRDILRGSIVLLGVGNTQKGDDGAGSFLATRLARTARLTVIDAGTTPENHLEKIVRAGPDTLLIVDAADFGGSPGEIGGFDAEKIAGGGISTHALSLDMTREYVCNRLPSARVWLLAIQPVRLDGTELSAPVRESCDLIENALTDLLSG